MWEIPEDVTEEMQEVCNDVQTENPEDLMIPVVQASCLALKGDRKLSNQVKSLQCKLKERRKNLRKTQTKVCIQVKFRCAFFFSWKR